MAALNLFNVSNISHSELKEWIQKHISPDLKDVGDLGTGIEFCLGTFILFPNTISLKKIRVGGLSQYDKYHNFKCLQAAFNDLDLNKGIPMEQMMKMTFRDNFYFGCWFKTFFEANYDGEPYDIKRLFSHCQMKNTRVVCECFQQSMKCPVVPVKYNIRVKETTFHYYPKKSKTYPNGEVSIKLMPKTFIVGQSQRRLLKAEVNRGRRGSTGMTTLLCREEMPILSEDAKSHQICLSNSKSKDTKSLKDILACKSDTDFATKKHKHPPVTGGCVSQADLCRSLNVAMSQIRKALITIRAGFYEKISDDLDKRHKDHSNTIEYYDEF